MVNKSTSGHSQRLRERFLNSGLQGFHDHLIIAGNDYYSFADNNLI